MTDPISNDLTRVYEYMIESKKKPKRFVRVVEIEYPAIDGLAQLELQGWSHFNGIGEVVAAKVHDFYDVTGENRLSTHARTTFLMMDRLIALE